MGLFSSRSSSNTSTTNNLYDQRSVVDAGGGVAGTGNQWDQSVTAIDNGQQTWNWDASQRSDVRDSGNTAWNWDASQRTDVRDSGNQSTVWNWDASQRSDVRDSGNTATTNTDNSQRTNTDSGNVTWNWDASQRSDVRDSGNTTTTINSSVIDGGAFGVVRDVALAQTDAARAIGQLATDAAREASSSSFRLAEAAQRGAIDGIGSVAARALGSADTFVSRAYGLADSSQASAFKTYGQALNYAGERFDSLTALAQQTMQTARDQAAVAGANVRDAYKSAADSATGNRTLMLAALAAVAVVAVWSFSRGKA